MNAQTAAANALPTILDQPASTHVGRRQRIDDFCLNLLDLDRFNRLLARLGRRSAPLNRDQLATAARELCVRNTNGDPAPCIELRMRRADSVVRMTADPAWEPANEAMDAAGLVVGYVSEHDDLIPDRLQSYGRLDDAIVIETAWPSLAAEVENYLDFRRLRQVEAELRDCASTEFDFTRADWEQAREAEAALFAHQRAVGEHSYLPTTNGMFRIH